MLSNSAFGSSLSILPTSLENLFIILPIGFKSKKRIFDSKTDFIILLWIRLAASKLNAPNAAVRIIVISAAQQKKTKKIFEIILGKKPQA